MPAFSLELVPLTKISETPLNFVEVNRYAPPSKVEKATPLLALPNLAGSEKPISKGLPRLERTVLDASPL